MSTVLPTDTTSVTVNDGVPIEFYYVREPSYTHKLDGENVRWYVDELDAYKQAVYKIINTERYDYIIYSWDYGIELKDLIGQHKFYVIPELERRITEAIMQDDRTISVDSFEFDDSKRGVISVTFTCHSIHGDFETNMNVEI